MIRGLLFSGGEDTYPFDEISEPVPRGHKPRCIDSAGGFLMERLDVAVSSSGARLSADTRADALVVDGGTSSGCSCEPTTAPGLSGPVAG